MNCPVELTIEILGGRWKCQIIHQLFENKKRFHELRDAIPEASQKMLTKHLRELEKDEIINRVEYDSVPKKTEYSLTEIGKSLEPVLKIMADWAIKQKGAEYNAN